MIPENTFFLLTCGTSMPTSIRSPDPVEQDHESPQRPHPDAVSPDHHPQAQHGQLLKDGTQDHERDNSRPQRKAAAHAEHATVKAETGSRRNKANPRNATLQQLAPPDTATAGRLRRNDSSGRSRRKSLRSAN